MPGKRKREVELASDEKGVDGLTPTEQWVQYAVDILATKEHGPAMIDLAIKSCTKSERDGHKKSQPSASPQTTIRQAADLGLYHTVQDLVTDLNTALKTWVPERAPFGEETKPLLHDDATNSGPAKTLLKRLNQLIATELMRPDSQIRFRSESEGEVDVTKIKDEEGIERENGDNKVILTLCGGDRSAKQMFSSLPTQSLARTLQDADTSLLPPGVTLTSVVPFHARHASKTTPKTLGSVFSSRHVRTLEPPKPLLRNQHTKNNVLTWTTVDPATSASSKDESSKQPYWYIKQALPTARWLRYNNMPSFDSPESKRKFYERAASAEEPQSTIDEDIKFAHLQAVEDALFQTAYSSFAPDHDNSAAVVSAEEKNWLWWIRNHEQVLHSGMISSLPQETDATEGSAATAISHLDPKLVESSLVDWTTPQESDNMGIKDEEPELPNKDHTALLQRVSELLEILSSHQRLRHLSLSNNARTHQSNKDQLSSAPTDANTPPISEIETFDKLRIELVNMVSTLPPYMLAKLNGDQLRDLNISTKVSLPTHDRAGVMREEILSPPIKTSAVHSSVPTSAYGHTSASGPLPTSRQYTPRGGHAHAASTRPSASGPRGTPVSAPYNTGPRTGYNSQRTSLGQGAPPAQYPQYPTSYRASAASTATPNGYRSGTQLNSDYYPRPSPATVPRPQDNQIRYNNTPSHHQSSSTPVRMNNRSLPAQYPSYPQSATSTYRNESGDGNAAAILKQRAAIAAAGREMRRVPSGSGHPE